MLSFKKIAFVIILALSLPEIYSQTKHPFEIGAGVTADIGYPFSGYDGHSRIPGILPAGPTINLKYSKHEVIVGSDLYRIFTQAKYRIIGVQAAYRYHFYRENKKANLFLDCNLQYVQFSIGTILPVSYNFSSKNPNDECNSIYKSRSLFNTYNLGIELPFLNYFSFTIALGIGYNYLHSEIDPSCTFYSPVNHSDNVIPVSNLRVGLVCRLYVFKKKLMN